MSDKITIKQYELKSEDFISRYNVIEPSRLYELISTFFHKQLKTLDIGCASGRDLSYLEKSGFDAVGLDVVEDFVRHCKKEHPLIKIHLDSLPTLLKIKDDSYNNILLSAILMHLPSHEIIEATANILRITKPGGRIIISIRNFRNSESATNEREKDGRLFTHIPVGRLTSLFEGLGAKLIFQEDQSEEHREEVIWHNFVFEKFNTGKKEGIDRIQEILIKDKKSSSYKLALLRGLNYIARHENGVALYDNHREYVWVPLRRLAFTWIKYYFPLLKTDKPFKQIASASNLAIESYFHEELANYKQADLSLLIDEYDKGINREVIDKVLKKLSKVIKNQPMTYTKNDQGKVFLYNNPTDTKLFFERDYEAGSIGIPVTIWHDLMLFGHWIDDGLFIQWANFIKNIDKGRDYGEILTALMEPIEDKRTTHSIHNLFKDQTVECTWSGQTIEKFQVDHVIPYALWKNNDLWNLLPSTPVLNSKKSDKLPSQSLLRKRKDCIIHYWTQYNDAFPIQFSYQLGKSLGISVKDNWQNSAHFSMMETISRLSVHKIGDVWDY